MQDLISQVEDFNATLPKSRLPQNITLTEV